MSQFKYRQTVYCDKEIPERLSQPITYRIDDTLQKREIINLVNRLNAYYAVGPLDENGNPEFGWKDMKAEFDLEIKSLDLITSKKLLELLEFLPKPIDKNIDPYDKLEDVL